MCLSILCDTEYTTLELESKLMVDSACIMSIVRLINAAVRYYDPDILYWAAATSEYTFVKPSPSLLVPPFHFSNPTNVESTPLNLHPS